MSKNKHLKHHPLLTLGLVVAASHDAFIHRSKEGSNLKIEPENEQTVSPDSSTSRAHKSRPRSIEINVEAYQSLLDQAELTSEQRIEFLEAIWSIIVAFIDLGFDVHPVQQAAAEAEPERQLASIVNEFVRDAA